MADTTINETIRRDTDNSCDIRIWSGECEHSTGVNGGERYLCDICGTLIDLEHEVHPAAPAYVSGDYDLMS